jgi:hypothetical protein
VNIQQFAVWVSTQNEIVSKVEIENEATQPTTERAQFVETVNINLYIVINSKKVTSNEDRRWLRTTDSVFVVRKDMLLGNVRRKRLVQMLHKNDKTSGSIHTINTVSGHLESRASTNTGKGYHIDIKNNNF